jgi:alpha-tubulin suppressor-like RCC1 family protein
VVLATLLPGSYVASAPQAALDPVAGNAWAWGSNISGQLGDGTSLNDRRLPQPVRGLGAVAAVAGDDDHSLALLADGSVWGGGQNLHGQVGDGTQVEQPVAPVRVVNLSGVRAIAARAANSIALKSDGTVWAWGLGPLGDGNSFGSSTPQRVGAFTDVVPVDLYTLLRSDGTVWAWGGNASGEVGDGTFVFRGSPVQVLNLSNVIAISAASSFKLALTSDVTVWGWGGSPNGQLGDAAS